MDLAQFLSEDFRHLSDDFNLYKEGLSSKKIIITGATGFIGKWLLYYFIFINKHFNIKLEILALSRDPETFLEKHPEIKNTDFIKWKQYNLGDPLHLDFIPDFFIHMATDVSKTRSDSTPSSLLEIINWMDNIISYARLETTRNNHNLKMLYLSSGAVYGDQTVDIKFMSESQQGKIDPICTSNFYGESKRICESMGFIEAKNNPNFQFLSARCFAFSGPFLPLDTTYALGNFIGNFLKDENVEINGNGEDLRSYLYGADLAHWLLILLLRGKNGQAYNVGSEDIYTIKQVAETVSAFKPNLKVKILNKDINNTNYVPSTHKAKSEFNLRSNFSLQHAIDRMIKFNQKFKNV